MVALSLSVVSGQKNQLSPCANITLRTNHFRSAKPIMPKTRNIAKSKAKDFADSLLTHSSTQVKWQGDIGLGTRLLEQLDC